MRQNNLVIKSVRKASSLSCLAIRVTKSDALHDDVEEFLFRTQADTARLVDKLLNNEFMLARYTDPTYPV
jgi:hypothetical protein